jgi:hypothetical protein
MPRHLVASARITGVDIFVDELSHARPVVIMGYQLEGLLLTEVARRKGIVTVLEDIGLEGVECRDVN